jgi:hypothetical protein
VWLKWKSAQLASKRPRVQALVTKKKKKGMPAMRIARNAKHRRAGGGQIHKRAKIFVYLVHWEIWGN